MIFRTPIFIVFLFFISCSQKNKFPLFVSEKVEMENVNLNTQLPIFSAPGANNSIIVGLEKLATFQNQYLKKDLEFDLDEFKRFWDHLQNEIDFVNARSLDLNKWFEISGLLLQLTGDAVYAVELNRMVSSGIGESIEENKKRVSPYVFTKNVDHLFVNIFTPAKINYNHTLKGKVEVEMETNYPKSGKVDLKFSMTERRYIEVKIRIPGWAEGATVIVKKVKYFAPPGGYCKIAKKWKEGDLVEIDFPMENMPDYLK